MVSSQYIDDQLKKIGFSVRFWTRPEVKELTNIILPDEQIFECVNGYYEGGLSLLVATNIRILLVDKKPFKFLTVEDLRFDTINQIDYGHRFMDAHISIATGLKTLKFISYNQQRLRKLIGHVQHRMAEIKSEQTGYTERQQMHLQQIDKQLQTYLLAQYQQHESVRRQLDENGVQIAAAQSTATAAQQLQLENQASSVEVAPQWDPNQPLGLSPDPSYVQTGVSSNELYEEGVKEIFGKHSVLPSARVNAMQEPEQQPISSYASQQSIDVSTSNALDVNPLRIAYSKLPMLLRNRQFSRTPVKEAAKV